MISIYKSNKYLRLQITIKYRNAIHLYPSLNSNLLRSNEQPTGYIWDKHVQKGCNLGENLLEVGFFNRLQIGSLRIKRQLWKKKWLTAHEWIEWVSEWSSEWWSEWWSEWMSDREWLCEWVRACERRNNVSEWVSVRTNKRMHCTVLMN